MNLTPRVLTDAEYASLKKRLHHGHDTIIKVTLYEEEAVREIMSKIIMPLLNGIKIDLDGLKLDKNTYIRPNLQVFYSDVVYLTTLIDETNNTKEPIDLAFLIEHKSEMPTELSLRLQFVDYINGIMKKNYDPKTDKTIPVIAIVFNQFDKDWEMKPYRSLFPHLSTVSRFLLEFDYLVINLANLSDEIMDSLDKFGILKAALLAMRYVKKKEFLKTHFEEIFLFLQQHPEKTDLRDQLIAYVLGESDFSAQDLEELLNNIFSPILKQEIMITGTGFLAVAAREAATEREARLVAEKAALISATNEKKARAANEKIKREALQSKINIMMRVWYFGVPLDSLMSMFDLPPQKLTEFISAFEKVKTYYSSKAAVDMKELRKISGLKDVELKPLLMLLQQKK